MEIPSDLYKKLIIKEIRQERRDFKDLIFEESSPISYKAGQYLTFVDFVYGEEVRRSYSIISSPEWNEPLGVGVKRMENGYFSRKLVDHAQIGDQVITTGAGGLFTLPDEIQPFKQIFFFAAGSGITPIFSLIKSALFLFPAIKLTLIYSNPSPEQTIYKKEIIQIAERFAQQFHVEFLYSNSRNLQKARLYPELLMQLVQSFSISDKENILFYVCGPESYMRMIIFTLQRERVPSINIKKEHFLVYQKATPTAEPPDKEQHFVTIHFSGKTYHYPVQYPQTILSAAKREGILLPYSCEVGRCGNCLAKCKEGTVWMSYNEVLTDNDLNKGMTLTCVGYPVGGDVTLTI
ncbi:iron-sulfur cluster-binding domain-containing protein [Chitinophagaceae bacterium LB-8]|uniref:Iron-sulfur cluster-binding domain-containing protein n=1 Tax=Paraflavisolibacter caeni TaxID=2982496 RepID=A0A9X2XZ01_9BACT|nr:iron-sulfur cluster-binding domain-containing protein [Paraflavisolibacter caeni]MCU7552169.1 iron-sulfur cluster-binding domain-containing protein [Paraflavisolibacter caeni]